jgi:trans-aconitate 2-methyltransferase
VRTGHPAPYLFGDSDVAARRLRVLAEVFADSTRPFLLHAATGPRHLAVDLGCGPGFTTQLLASVLACDSVVGLDNSQHFITLAREMTTATVSFHLHDVASVPFPVPPADLLFCRLLVTHLREPRSVIARWATQLRPGGLLLMEEVEWIDTDHPVFKPYLEIVEALLRHQSYDPYVGRVLDELGETEPLIKRTSVVRRLHVTNQRAAAMFVLNAQAWSTHPFITTNYSSTTIAALQKELASLASTPSSASDIEWGMRQLVFERSALSAA